MVRLRPNILPVEEAIGEALTFSELRYAVAAGDGANMAAKAWMETVPPPDDIDGAGCVFWLEATEHARVVNV